MKGIKKGLQTLVSKSESPQRLKNTCRQFLPAALEVEETPAHPASRAIMGSVALLFVIVLVWACVGKIDIVATASGKIVPGERVKTIQPMVTGEVSTIYVKEGQSVNAGDPLLALDGTVTEAELTRLHQEGAALSLQLARHQAFTAFLATPWCLPDEGCYREQSVTLSVDSLAGAVKDVTLLAFEQRLLQQQVEDYRTARQALASELNSKKAEQQTTEAIVNKLQRVLPLIEERTEALEGLYRKNFASKVQYLELEQRRIELEEDVRAQQATVRQLQAEQQQIRHQLKNLHAQKRRESLDQQEQLHRQLSSVEQESIKAEALHGQQVLTAPIAGTVQQLKIHTIGGVVQPAQALMQIVPAEAHMEVEAWVLNKDIGFVHEGQPTSVKIDTFNFTKYGLIEGSLQHISDDAVADEEQGLRYLANVQLTRDWMQVDQRQVSLSPGMSVAVEIKTGQRRLIEYFLSPLLRFKQESIRER